MTMIARIRRAAERRAEFARTRAELSRLPIDTQLDLDLYAGDADRIAARAVYG